MTLLGSSPLFVAIGGCSLIPPIPARPGVDTESARGWISFAEGRYRFILPRAEMGQGIEIALQQVICAELGIGLRELETVYHQSSGSPPSRATVGSESVQDFAIPIAQAAASLRDAVESGGNIGQVTVVEREIDSLRFWRDTSFIGGSPNDETHAKLTKGALPFTADVAVAGMVFGRVLRAPASLELKSIPSRYNLEAAQSVSGFIDVLDDDALTLGKSVGLGILAASNDALNDIERVLSVEWSVEEKILNLEDHEVDVDRHFPEFPDGDGALDLRFDIKAAPHNPIEPRSALADMQGDRLHIWTGSQDIFYVRDTISRNLGWEAERILVHSMRIGGAFGGKTICNVEWEAARLATHSGKPVQVQWTRAQELANAFHRPPVSYRIQAAMVDGEISSWTQRIASSHILLTNAVLPDWLQGIAGTFIDDAGVTRGSVPPYKTRDFETDVQMCRLGFHTGPWRGLGAGPNATAIESALDELCIANGTDPLSFRVKNATDERLSRVCDSVGTLSNGKTRKAYSVMGKRYGYGMAAGIYKGKSYAAAVAEVSVDSSGNVKVEHIWCTHDCGKVINPDRVKAQIEGNIAWGVGLVLRDTLSTRNGAVQSRSFFDCPIPRMSEMPSIEIELVEPDENPTGAGETMIVAAPGAIANAIRNATGMRPTQFPVQPSDYTIN